MHRPLTKTEKNEGVTEMQLCEPPHIFLRPNQLYIFTVDPNCEKCKEANKPYEGEKCKRCRAPLASDLESRFERCGECLLMSGDCCD